MDKGLFYLVLIMLILAGFVCLIFSDENRPMEYLSILIVVLAIANLSLAVIKSWGLWAFVGLTVGTLLCALVIGTLNLLVNQQHAQPGTLTMVYGIRWLSMIWPTAVFYIGTAHYDKKTKEEKESTKTKVKNL